MTLPEKNAQLTDGRTDDHAHKRNFVEPFLIREGYPVRSPTNETSMKIFSKYPP